LRRWVWRDQNIRLKPVGERANTIRPYGILVEIKALVDNKYQENEDVIYNPWNPIIHQIRDSKKGIGMWWFWKGIFTIVWTHHLKFVSWRREDDACIVSTRKMSLIFRHNHNNHRNQNSDKNTIKGFKPRLPTYHLKWNLSGKRREASRLYAENVFNISY
jgi:hypothetical protein